ncbi:MAG: hypothetical protein INR71_14560 [Terriglobus roseus]|nr:hypothetical protein [Terriglobus roseus]
MLPHSVEAAAGKWQQGRDRVRVWVQTSKQAKRAAASKQEWAGWHGTLGGRQRQAVQSRAL